MLLVPSVTVADLLKAGREAANLSLEVLSGQGGLDRLVGSPHIQKTGLALAGFHEFLHPARVLVFGESEVRFLENLDPAGRRDTLAATFAHDIPCVLITGGWEPPPELLAASDRHRVPVLRTAVATPHAIARIGALLEHVLAVREVIHGVLLDILGLGVLIVGESGIGKSECALDLIVRGHRLVADDTVDIRRRGDTAVVGSCPALTRYHMEVRGLGVINIRDLFGVAAIRTAKRVELVVQLERWDPEREYDRLGLDDLHFNLLGVRIPLVRMPVAPGRSLAILVEVAARNQLLRSRGLNAARDLASKLERRLRAPIAEAEPAPAGGQDDTDGDGDGS